MTEQERFEINFERLENGLPPLEGWEEWAKHQVAVSDNKAKEIDKALGIQRCQCGYAMPCSKTVPIAFCKLGMK